MKIVDVAEGCGISVSFLYNLRGHHSGHHHMHTVLRIVYGLSRLLGVCAEDLFVEYILGEVVGRYPSEGCNTIREWLDRYSGRMTMKDLAKRVGIDQTRISFWIHKGGYPSDAVLRWLIQGMCGEPEEICRSFFRMVEPQD